MGDFKPGTYNIQRSSDKKYLNVVGGLVQTSASDAYKWTIVAAESGQFYIQDPVYADWLYDNGSTGYLIKPVQNLNSEWSGLTTDQPGKITNKGTGKALQIPYGASDQTWTLVSARAASS